MVLFYFILKFHLLILILQFRIFLLMRRRLVFISEFQTFLLGFPDSSQQQHPNLGLKNTGVRGFMFFFVAHTQLFLSTKYEKVIHPCVLVSWFSTIGHSLCPDTGM